MKNRGRIVLVFFNSPVFLIGLAFFFLLTAILGIFAKQDGENVFTSETVLLNPKYLSVIEKISLSRLDDTELIIEKVFTGSTANVWRGSLINRAKTKLVFPVDPLRVDKLLSLAAQKRKLTKFAKALKSNTGLRKNDQPLVLSFYKSDAQIVSRLYFDRENFSGSLVYFYTDKSTDVFSAANDFYSFLVFAPAAWADARLIPEYIRGDKTEGSIDFVSIKFMRPIFLQTGLQHLADDVLNIKIAAGDPNFTKTVQGLLGVRSSRIVFLPEKLKSSEIICKIQVVHTDGFTAAFSVYAQEGSSSGDEEQTYLAVPLAFDLSYALEISGWTFQSLIDSFIKTN